MFRANVNTINTHFSTLRPLWILPFLCLIIKININILFCRPLITCTWPRSIFWLFRFSWFLLAMKEDSLKCKNILLPIYRLKFIIMHRYGELKAEALAASRVERTLNWRGYQFSLFIQGFLTRSPSIWRDIEVPLRFCNRWRVLQRIAALLSIYFAQSDQLKTVANWQRGDNKQ